MYKFLHNGNITTSILLQFTEEYLGLHCTLKYTICVNMAERHTATVIANYLSTVESDSSSDDEENDEYSELSSCVEELSEEDEDVSIVDSGAKPADIDDSTAADEGESGGRSSSSIDLIPKKGTKSEAWRHF